MTYESKTLIEEVLDLISKDKVECKPTPGTLPMEYSFIKSGSMKCTIVSHDVGRRGYLVFEIYNWVERDFDGASFVTTKQMVVYTEHFSSQLIQEAEDNVERHNSDKKVVLSKVMNILKGV